MRLFTVRKPDDVTGSVIFATTAEHRHNYETYYGGPFGGVVYAVEGPDPENPLVLDQGDVDALLQRLGIFEEAVRLCDGDDGCAAAYRLVEPRVAEWAREQGYDALVVVDGDLLPVMTDGPPEVILLHPDRYQLREETP